VHAVLSWKGTLPFSCTAKQRLAHGKGRTAFVITDLLPLLLLEGRRPSKPPRHRGPI